MKLRITASRHTPFYTPLVCTMAAGFLDKHGIEYTYGVLPAGETSASMIAAGKTDVVQTAPSTNWARMEKGETGFPLNFALINRRDGFFLVPCPASFKDLEGKRILADFGSQPLTMLRYALHFNGVQLEKVEFVKSGEADYVHMQSPKQPGLSLGAATPPNAFSSLCASRQFLATETYRAFHKAFAEAKEWVRRTPAAEIAATEASHFPDYPLSVLAGIIDRYKAMGAWDGGPEIPRDLYEQSLNVFESTGAIKVRQRYDDVCVEF
ncbi:MAG TPA: ABC transporter substrate-binding protein [Bryobacteraceae bacterium]|nr:ABC transporter substrate-binding protein [Bryobacteraceae bacterium]